MEEIEGHRDIGQTVVLMRGRLSISQSELAMRIGSTQDNISKVEHSDTYNPSTEFAFKLSSEANEEEASVLLSVSSLRRNNIVRMLHGATATLKAFYKWDHTPLEAQQLLGDFLPKWEGWLSGYHKPLSK